MEERVVRFEETPCGLHRECPHNLMDSLFRESEAAPRLPKVAQEVLRRFLHVTGASAGYLGLAGAERGEARFSLAGEGFAGYPPPRGEDAVRLAALSPPGAVVFRLSDSLTCLDVPLWVDPDTLGVVRGVFAQGAPREETVRDTLGFFSCVAGFALATACALDREALRCRDLVAQTEKFSSLGRMAAGIAHEVNNPLTGILLLSTSLSKHLASGDPVRENIDVIVEETMRCRNLLKNLLEFSRTATPALHPADLNRVAEKALAIVDNELRLRRIELETGFDPCLGAVRMDAGQIEQVLVNLLLNAAEAVGGGGRVSLRLGRAENPPTAWMEVADDGPGIDPAARERIFEPFYSTKEKGTGLGLAVSRAILRNHRGDIRVDSEPGRGARFRVSLPLSPGPEGGA